MSRRLRTQGGARERAKVFALAAQGLFPSLGSVDGFRVIPLTNRLKILAPPLFFCSLPKRAIGFSFPTGTEGRVLGGSLLVATVAISVLLSKVFGLPGVLAMVWIGGGTTYLILHNSMRQGLAFVKLRCSSCRLHSSIEEHEAMHLSGGSSEEVVWAEARKKSTYEGLSLGGDPAICSFCPIAKRLKSS